MLEDRLSGIELGRRWVPHVFSVVQVGDGKVQGEGHQSGASGCSGGRREKCPVWTLVRTKVAWSSNSGAPSNGPKYSHGLQKLKERMLWDF